jgi:hypothetical protein
VVPEGTELNGNLTMPYSKKLRKYCPLPNVNIFTDIVSIPVLEARISCSRPLIF